MPEQLPTAYEFLAPALRAKGFSPRAISRACGMVKRVNGDPVRVLAAFLAGTGATDPAAFAARLLHAGSCPPESFLEEAARLLTPEPAAAEALGAELDAVGRQAGTG